jgi:ferredoxin--NADP+ reductase
MQTVKHPVTEANRLHAATLLRSNRITPAASPEEVRQLTFRTEDLAFDGQAGHCLRVMAPGQFGNQYHARLYSIADLEHTPDGTEFSLCVRRCAYIDDFNGERYQGVASNYLCDLRPGDAMAFAGPVGYPFAVPEQRDANILMIGMGTGIAPFRGLIRLIYEKIGSWQGKVRLYYGARSGLEMLYMNDENSDLASYYDQPTFKAFQAVSPRPHFDAPIELDKALERNAAEVWEMLQSPNTHVYVAGTEAMAASIDKALAGIAGSAGAWDRTRGALADRGRWSEVLY